METHPTLPDAAQFWTDLHQAVDAIGHEHPLTAHGRLERCRIALIDLYRLALSPGAPGGTYEGADSLPGGNKALDSLLDWLVAPLDLKAQWRCAHRLATTFEKLMLPLAERLGLAYPWTIRNLAFQRLDETRSDRTATAAELPPVPGRKDLTAEPDQQAATPRTSEPARFKLKTRRQPQEDGSVT
jgi:hypothetical protein